MDIRFEDMPAGGQISISLTAEERQALVRGTLTVMMPEGSQASSGSPKVVLSGPGPVARHRLCTSARHVHAEELWTTSDEREKRDVITVHTIGSIVQDPTAVAEACAR